MPPRRYQQRRGPRPQRRRNGQGGAAVADAPVAPRPTGPVEIPASVAVKDLATALGISHADIIKELIRNGIFATINQSIDFDTAALVAAELGYEVTQAGAAGRAAAEEAEEADLVAPGAERTDGSGRPEIFTEDEAADLVDRAPIVTVMGHVDHGKTSLLDAIRSTTVAAGERGGITQHIGASEVEKDSRRVVFLDTPGHEAFTAMRARGAKVPIVVAVNKVDKPDSNPERVKTELSEHGVVIEEYGGDVPLVPVSAKQGTGIEDLLDTILIVADVQELKANPKRSAVGTVVEAELDKGRGPVATVLVQTGTLRIGDTVIVGDTYGRVRALETSRGDRVSKAGPASAVVLLGLGEVPGAGDILRAVPDEKTARAMIEERRAAATARPEGTGRATLEDLYRQIQAGQTKELRVIIKADVSGSLGAIRHALEQLDSDEVRINILLEGTGDVSDNDINLASASDAVVVGFNVKLDPTARRTAETDGVDVRLYDIIYRLTEEMDAALKGMLEPEEVEVVEGRAEVRQIFRVGKTAVIAGGYVTDGRIVRGGARVYRGGRVVATDRIESLRRFRDDVREVAAGFECGIGLAGSSDLQEGDIIECFTTQTVSRVVQG